MYFRFGARKVTDKKCDIDNKYVISFFLSDDTILINILAEKVRIRGGLSYGWGWVGGCYPKTPLV